MPNALTSSETAGEAQRALDAARGLADALRAENYRGWDPYDALSSPLLRRLARSPALRRAAIQALRRSPINARPLLGIPRAEHSKALALLVSAHTRLAGIDDKRDYAERTLELASRLAGRAVETDTGLGWGYDFDVQTRWGYYRRGQANAVVTAFAGHALLDADELTGRDEYRPLVAQAISYALSDLLVDRDGDLYFGYFTGSTIPIHNASVVVAGLVARAGEAAELARTQPVVRYVLDRQRPDGAWPYGEGRGLGWVDGYHTAYVLQGLHRWETRTNDRDVRAALERGLDYYLERLLDSDGAPRASDRRRYPIDAHGAGTALAALADLADYDPRCIGASNRVLDWTLSNLRRADGRFAFRRGRMLVNRVPYIRWSDGHILLGLAAQAALSPDAC